MFGKVYFGKVYVVTSEVPDLDTGDAKFVADVEDAFTYAGMAPTIEAKAAPALSSGGPCCLGPIFVNVYADHFADITYGESVTDFFRWWRALEMNCGILAATLYHQDHWVVSRQDTGPPPDWSSYRRELDWLDSTVFVVADLYDAGIPGNVRAKFAAIGARILGIDKLKAEVSCLRSHLRDEGSRQSEVVVVHLGPELPKDWDDWRRESPPFGKSAAVFVRPTLAPWPRSPRKALSVWSRLRLKHGGAVPDARALGGKLLALVLEVPEAGALPEAVLLESTVRELLLRELGAGRPFVLSLRTGQGTEITPDVVAEQIGPWLAQTVLGSNEAAFGFEPLAEPRPDLDGRLAYFVARKVADVPVVEQQRHLNRLRPGAGAQEAAA